MDRPTLEVRTADDGALIVRPRGAVDADDAVELRRLLVHAVRRLRPSALIIDLADALTLDAITIGTLAAACVLGDDHQVPVHLHNVALAVAADLTAAGVGRHHLRTR